MSTWGITKPAGETTLAKMVAYLKPRARIVADPEARATMAAYLEASAKAAAWIMTIARAVFYLRDAGLLASVGENWPLLILFAAPALMIAGPLDLGLGLSKLFRNDPDRPSFLSRSVFGGLGATLLVIMIWSVIFFCEMHHFHVMNRTARETGRLATLLDGLIDREKLELYPVYLLYGSPPFLAILLLCVLFPTHTAETAPDDRGEGRWRVRAREVLDYLIGSALAIILMIVFYGLVDRPAQRWIDESPLLTTEGLRAAASHLLPLVRVDPLTLPHFALFVLTFATIFGLLLRFGPRLSVGLYICLVLNLAAMGYFTIQIISPSWNVPVVGGAIFYLVWANHGPYKYRYPGMGDHYEDPIELLAVDESIERGQLKPDETPHLLDDRAVLEAWAGRMQGRDGIAKPKLVLVAVTGAAYRASFWTTVVLETLGREIPDFFDHVRLITGASGGMVGAAYAAVLVNAPGEGGDATARATDCLLDDCKGNSLSPVVHQMIRRDLLLAGRPWFWPQSYDRGRALEDQWKTLDVTFADLREGERQGWRPSLVISPMVVETGRRLLFSNLDLYGLTDELARPRDGVSADAIDREGPPPSVGFGRRISRSAVEFFRAFPDLKGGDKDPERNFKLKTAVRMNAAFPLISPAVSLPMTPARRVVDAGYYDNYGVDLATSWAVHNRKWILENTSGLALIQIRAYRSESIRKRLWVGPRDAPPSVVERVFRGLATGLHALTTPIAGATSARQWSMSYRNDQTIQRLFEAFNGHGTAAGAGRDADGSSGPKPGFFETFVFENPVPFGMNWFISRAEIERMRDVMEPCSRQTDPGGEGLFDNCRQLALLRSWWEAEPTPRVG